MRVLRVYHGGRDPAHRHRDRALFAAGADLTLVIPSQWPLYGNDGELSDEPYPIVELPVSRPGDVNRHRYADTEALRVLIARLEPDVLDVHEEPVSLSARQLLEATPPEIPVVMYTAQNVDKRFPPPFSRYERCAYHRAAALYPCTRQAAAVARGKGFCSVIDVIPLGFDPALFSPGRQSLEQDEIVLALFGRLVTEKGVRDAVRVLAQVNRVRSARLVLVGSGPEGQPATQLARRLGVSERIHVEAWLDSAGVAGVLREAHVVLVPSVATTTWTEQFGRVIVEAQASGAVVAGYATGSIAEVAGAAAILAPSGDVDVLARRLLAVLSDAGAYAELREKGLASSQACTWERVVALQSALYAHVVDGGELFEKPLARSPGERRKRALAEFGPTAPTTAGYRPFALPWLRRGGGAAEALAKGIDVGAELRARTRRGSMSVATDEV